MATDRSTPPSAPSSSPGAPSPLFRLLIVQVVVVIWVLLLGGLMVMRNSGALSEPAVRVFTVILAVVAIAGPFAIIAAFLRRRSLADRRVAVEGCCPRCRYDLRGLPGWNDPNASKPLQCPECGAMVLRPPALDG